MVKKPIRKKKKEKKKICFLLLHPFFCTIYERKILTKICKTNKYRNDKAHTYNGHIGPSTALVSNTLIKNYCYYIYFYKQITIKFGFKAKKAHASKNKQRGTNYKMTSRYCQSQYEKCFRSGLR